MKEAGYYCILSIRKDNGKIKKIRYDGIILPDSIGHKVEAHAHLIDYKKSDIKKTLDIKNKKSNGIVIHDLDLNRFYE